MTDNDRTPVRPASVHFDAPTHEPLVAALLFTYDPELGEYRAYVRTGSQYVSPDRHLVALMMQSLEIRNLAERENPQP
jgi:hypothetical protein